MPPRRRPQFKEENIDQQLQQIHLLDPSSSSENLEQLGPIIKQIHTNRQQEAYLRTLQGLIESKDAEIEQICGDNYEDFISSVSTLFDVKSYTTNLRERITTLDGNVSQVGRGLVEKKKALLQSKKTAANLDEAIDTMQSCLRVLDVLNRIGDMVRDGKYWSALRVRLNLPLTISVRLMLHYSPLKTSRACLRPLSRKHHSSNIFCLRCPPCAARSKMQWQRRWSNGFSKSEILVHKLVNLPLNLWRLGQDDGEQEGKRTQCCGSIELAAPWRWSPMRRQNVCWVNQFNLQTHTNLPWSR